MHQLAHLLQKLLTQVYLPIQYPTLIYKHSIYQFKSNGIFFATTSNIRIWFPL